MQSFNGIAPTKLCCSGIRERLEAKAGILNHRQNRLQWVDLLKVQHPWLEGWAIWVAVLLVEELRSHINNIGLIIVPFMPYLGRI